MPYALTTIGLLMIITGINNTYAQFGTQLQGDFSGSKSFIVWIIALGSVGALGYINDLRSFSHYFMALILISMVLANKGVFQNFQAAIASGPATPQAPTTDVASGGSSTSSGGDTTGLFGQSPGVPGQTGTSGQSKFNQYMNVIPKLFGGG